MIWSTLIMAFREIRRNTLRSGLTALGIIIGVAAVIAMVTLGKGATAKVTSDIAKMGNNMLTVMPGADRRGPASTSANPFKLADVQAIAREIRSLRAVAPSVSRSALVVSGNKNRNTTIQGSTNAYFEIRGYTLSKGRIFADVELSGGTPACVLGATVFKELFGSQDPVGSTLRVGSVTCRVVGALEAKGQSTFGGDPDDFVVMPISAVQRRLAGNNDVGAILVSVANERSTDRAKSQIMQLMRERRRIASGQVDDFSVMDMKEISQTMETVTGALTALLGAIAAVSLLVGGIGIMNIMLVSVTERTREIGVRLAIGASGSEVLLQFLVEAIVLSTFGGVAGLLLGLLSSYAGSRVIGLPFVLVPEISVIAVLFSALVGIGFGYFPARRAARLNPIEALRHE